MECPACNQELSKITLYSVEETKYHISVVDIGEYKIDQDTNYYRQLDSHEDKYICSRCYCELDKSKVEMFMDSMKLRQ